MTTIANTRQINAAGLKLIKGFESCVLRVYKDSIGLATVGWGHRTFLPIGTPITQQTADSLLAQDLEVFERGVTALVTVPLNDNQYAAMVSFAFNLGLGLKNPHGGFAHSAVRYFLNQGDYAKAAALLTEYDHGGGHEIAGLLRRREAEAALFRTPVADV